MLLLQGLRPATSRSRVSCNWLLPSSEVELVAGGEVDEVLSAGGADELRDPRNTWALRRWWVRSQIAGSARLDWADRQHAPRAPRFASVCDN